MLWMASSRLPAAGGDLDPVRRGQQVGVGLVVRAADAAAQLVQLRQAELVGAVDDDGVGGRHVDAGLDDGGAQQQVETLMGEVAHHVFQLAFRHLAVGDFDARFRQQLDQLLLHGVDGVHLVVQEEDLAAALEFAQGRLADQAVADRLHEGLDRQALLRRGGDHREIADAFQRHRQGAGNRRRGQGEHVHLGAQLLHPLLLPHAEAVFLVDDGQAQVLEHHVLLQQLVGADDDVDGAALEAGLGGGDFLGRAEAGKFGDPHRGIGEAVGEGLEVLFGEQGGGAEHRHLLAAGGGDEGGAQRHLGLAEADVAADQAVHGPARGHVADHRLDGGELVRGLLEAESGGEGVEVVRGGGEGVALARLALGVEVEQFRRRVARLFHRPPLGLLPLAAAEAVQRRAVRVAAEVAGDQVEVRDRHVEDRKSVV